MTRDDTWLQLLLEDVWHNYFSDIKEAYPLSIKFGRKARTRLGSLSYYPREEQAVIRVSGLFKDSSIPESVVRATIVHEMCHYAHGFNSGHIQKFDYPHAGGVIRSEFTERGLEKLYIEQKKWLKEHWRQYIRVHYPPQPARRRAGKKKRFLLGYY